MKYFLQLVTVCITFVQLCNAQYFPLAKSFHGSGVSASGIARDGIGNIFTIGSFGQSINFGSDSVVNGSCYLVKHDANGIYIWSRSITEPGSGWVYPVSISACPNGNIIVVGSFATSSISIGNNTLTNFSAPNQCFYVACYNSSGNVVWAKCSDGNGDQFPYAVATDSQNSVYVTGVFISPSISFGSITLTSGSSGIYKNSFVVKYDQNGNVVWANGIGGTDQDIATAICTDFDGDVYVTGGCSSPTLAIGSSTLNPIYFDVFLVKYSASGSVLWAKGIGQDGSELGSAISVDEHKNIYLAGTFNPSITIGNTTLYKYNCYSGSAFLAKLDSNGDAIWAKGGGGPTPNNILALSSYSSGVYVGGLFIGSMVMANYTVNSVSNKDGDFIIKYDSAGNVECSYPIYANANGSHICNDRSGVEVYITGMYKNSPLTLGSATLPNSSFENIYFAKFSCYNIQSIQERIMNTALKVYPNPSSNEVNLISSHDESLLIYNELSQNVGLVELNFENNYKKKIENLSPGVYFVKGKVSCTKVVILRE
jgi:hypothetical protein